MPSESASHHSRTDSTQIAIPTDAQKLGEFIASLLGQPRIIEQRFRDRRFVIDTNWLLNLDQIIEQRLTAQNQGKLVSFCVRIYFANGKVLSLGSHQAFRSFNDLSNEIAVGLDLRWTHLIKFPLAELPEKQEIRFLAFTDRSIREFQSITKEQRKLFLSSNAEKESLSISIRSTNVTWGEDLHSQISKYILGRTESTPKWKTTIRGWRSTAAVPISAALSMMLLLVGVLASLFDRSRKLLGQFGQTETLKTATEGEKLDLLIQLALARLRFDDFPVDAIFRGGAVVIAAVALYLFLAVRKSSFISLNSFSDQYLANYGRNYDLIRYGILGSAIVSIVSGIFSNRLYDYLKLFW